MNRDDPTAGGRITEPERFAAACRQFDFLNSEDPQTEECEGQQRPRELLYAERLTRWVLAFAPHASEALRLAARCQHLQRWAIPRGRYAMTRAGYLQWRSTLKQFHADQSEAVLRKAGYPDSMIARVRDLNLKRNLAVDPEMQVLEDALCLVFLEWQLTDLAHKTDEEKTVNALRKSWLKMSPAARERALKLDYGPIEKGLLERALAQSDRS